MLQKVIFSAACLLLVIECGVTQSRIGIGTDDPQRTLEVAGSGPQNIRVQTTFNSPAGIAGIELVRGGVLDAPIDWQLLNRHGTFEILSGNFNLYNTESLRMRVTEDDYVGIGSLTPETRLHISDGQDASLINNGHVQLGSTTSKNLIMDDNEIQARNNSSTSTLWLQRHGGNTHFNNNGGNVHLGYHDAKLGIGTTLPSHRVTISDASWQLYLNNNGNPVNANDWFVGATASNWGIGDDRLIFSPTSSSAATRFCLHNVSDNNGTTAPVSVHSDGGQQLLLDGNEIDSKAGALYINNNSAEEIYINPSGGKVGVGTTNPSAVLTLSAPENTMPFAMKRDDWRWELRPYGPNGLSLNGDLDWMLNGNFMASINGGSGQWWSISDRGLKENIEPLTEVLDKITSLDTYQYSFKHDGGGRKYVGVMAQQVKSVFPEAVHELDGRIGVAYGQLAVVALQAIKEQQQLITELEGQIAAIEQTINTTHYSSN